VVAVKKILVAALALIALSFLVSLWFYGALPARVASHWNAGGAVDGYASKNVALFLMPVLSLALLGLFLVLPRIDPLKRNYAAFQRYYDAFVLLFVAFLAYLHALTLYWNLGGRFSMTVLLSPAFAALFYYCGVLVEHAKRNWFVGIRTPWTLSSDRVWARTHEIGGKLFKACGVAALFGLVFQDIAIVLVVAPVIAVAAFSVVFSYVEFKKERKEGTEGKRKQRF
jgi:uncharacterized membrane protein